MTVPPPLPGQEPLPPRPTTVTTAAGLLVFEVVMMLVSAIFLLATNGTLSDAADRYLDAHNSSASANAGVSMVCGVLFDIVLGAAFVALALGLLRRNNVARIIAWVVCGIAVCCTAGSAISTAIIYGDYLPGWYIAWAIVTGVIQLLGYAAVIVLLALPASNDFFRKPTV